MGREVKRVALDFQWPLRKTWEGYVCPDRLNSITCEPCKGSGWNDACRQLARDWYDHDGFRSRWWYDYKTGMDGKPASGPPWKVFGESRTWQHSLVQEEVDHLIEEGRLNGYVSTWDDVERKWVRDPSKPWPTAEQINHDMHYGMGHDGINHALMVRFRAKRLGIYGVCAHCAGKGHAYSSPEIEAEAEAWERSEPPAGEGWQMWETVSEGSPVSPVCESADKLAAWMVRYGSDGGRPASFAVWRGMIEEGWVPSGVIVGGQFNTGVSGVTMAADSTRPAFNLYEKKGREQVVDRPCPGGMHRMTIQHENTYTFEAVCPSGIAADHIVEFEGWLDQREIEFRREYIGKDLLLTGALSVREAFEFKTRWV